MTSTLAILAVAWIGGIVGAYIAERRGVSVGVSFCIGALLGPIGWLIVGLLPHRGPPCPWCHAPLMAAGAIVCARCGRDCRTPAPPDVRDEFADFAASRRA